MKKHISVGVHLHKHGGTAIRGSSEWLPRRCKDVVEYTYDGPIGGGEIYGCAGKRLFKLTYAGSIFIKSNAGGVFWLVRFKQGDHPLTIVQKKYKIYWQVLIRKNKAIKSNGMVC